MIVLAAEFTKSATEPAGYPPPDAPEVAFCGRSNVGKSSCLNALANIKRLARVSKTPGRTRLINFFDLRVAEPTRSGKRGPEQALRLVDLPGYGFAGGPRSERDLWKAMIERYLIERGNLKALVILVDGEIGPQPSDREMVDWGKSLGRRTIVIATKLDKLSRTRRAAQVQKIGKELVLAKSEVLGFSAKDKFGLDELWKMLIAVTQT